MNEIPPGTPVAAPWSLFVGNLGKYSIIAALVLCVLAALLPLFSAKRPALTAWASRALVTGSLAIAVAFGCLTTLFVKGQYQYEYVYGHSEQATSLAYKIAAVWTAQQGSFLLWALMSALCAVITLSGTGPYRRAFVAANGLVLGTLSGILAYETPFNLMKEVIFHGKVFMPDDGGGMVPTLQNYWVIIHPPVIFLGFGSLSVLAAYGVAAMLHRDATDWVSRVRPWALASLAVLGLGISMGGLWAYETLGWGGFWAWDPVENVSFVPWLFVVTFVHGLYVQSSRKRWTSANLILAGLPFLIFVYGTFLTRSGLLDGVSNHSFASMDEKARGILRWFLIAVSLAYAGVYILRGREAGKLAAATAAEDQIGTHREGFLRYGMVLMGLFAIVIALGMSWPVFTALRGGKGSAIEEKLYHLVVVWFFLPIMLLMAITPFVAWRRMEKGSLWNRLFGVTCITIGSTGLLHMLMIASPFRLAIEPGSVVNAPFGKTFPLEIWMLVLLFSVMFVLVANVWRVAELAKRSAMGTGGFVSHLGLAVLLGGLILSRGYERKAEVDLREGNPGQGLGYTVALKGVTSTDLRDRNRKVEFDVTGPNGEKFVASPTHYQYGDPANPKDLNWPYIKQFATHDVYFAMTPPVVAMTEDPIVLKPGEKKDVSDRVTLEYLEMTRKGEVGATGSEFGAKLRLTETDENGERRQYISNPTLQITPEGMVPTLPRLGPNLRVGLPGLISPKDRSAQIMLFFSPPIYHVMLFEKPFTGLVWLGTGILTFGGLLAAFARRRVVATASRQAPIPDATLPAPQS